MLFPYPNIKIKAAMDMGVHLNTYPKVELLKHMVVLFLNSSGTSTLFSIVAVQVSISTDSIKGSLLSTSLATFAITCLFDTSHHNRSEVIISF